MLDWPAGSLNHFTPAVAAFGGTVLVTYRARREGSVRVDTRWIVSADGGVTFGRERRLGRPTDTRFAATVSGTIAFLGDYMGLALSGDAAHAVWCNASRPRAGTQHQTAWSATILP